MSDELAMTIASDVDVVSARQRGRELAEEVGFSAGDQTVIAAASSSSRAIKGRAFPTCRGRCRTVFPHRAAWDSASRARAA
jgi:hypothetical protein